MLFVYNRNICAVSVIRLQFNILSEYLEIRYKLRYLFGVLIVIARCARFIFCLVISRTTKMVYFLCDIILEMRCLSHITGVSTDLGLLLAVRPWGGLISHRITHRRDYDVDGIFL